MHLSQLKSVFAEAGATTLVVKQLSPNDNSKNQIYLGMGFAALNLLSFGALRPSSENATIKATMQLEWLDDDARRHPVPAAQLILYPQYPEVRMSAFLKGAMWAPSHIMASRDAGRILFLGISRSGKTLAYAAGANSPIVREFEADDTKSQNGVFWVIPIAGGDARGELMRELNRIHHLGWIRSKRLTASGIMPCKSLNCGGCTLEAELGIATNSKSGPDFNGIEVKSYGVEAFGRSASSPITLMTPEPTGGYYVDAGLIAFVKKYGYLDKRGRGHRMNFGGRHVFGKETTVTGLTLHLLGYDAATNHLNDPRQGIALLDRRGQVAAYWPYLPMMDHWVRKHTSAVFVPYQRRDSPSQSYRYDRTVTFGKGTDFMLLLKAFADGHVFYDPGIKVVETPGTKPLEKKRSQFRVSFSRISSLYHDTQVVAV